MSPRLSGKVCIITGTGGDMGRAAPLAFAREGALVVGCDLTVDAAEATVAAARADGCSTALPWHTSKTSRTRSGTKNRWDEVDLVF
jgi:NAD(P)-dependent dehydrogenase (short-subunit alcohol dehydrogenase family)